MIYQKLYRTATAMNTFMNRAVMLFLVSIGVSVLGLVYQATYILLFSPLVQGIVLNFRIAAFVVMILAAGAISLALLSLWVIEKLYRKVPPICSQCRYWAEKPSLALHCAVYPYGPDDWKHCSDWRAND